MQHWRLTRTTPSKEQLATDRTTARHATLKQRHLPPSVHEHKRRRVAAAEEAAGPATAGGQHGSNGGGGGGNDGSSRNAGGLCAAPATEPIAGLEGAGASGTTSTNGAGLAKDKVTATREVLYDTVGVVAVDNRGNVCAAVSSGGIALKKPGRVGQAGMYGCGCFAVGGRSCAGRGSSVNADAASDNDADGRNETECGGTGGRRSGVVGGSGSGSSGDFTCQTVTTVGVSTSGVGEELIKTQLASTCGRLLLSEVSNAS